MSGVSYDLRKIRGLVFDVDGVLSPSTVPLAADGNPERMANVKDGYALKQAVKEGYKIAIISGGICERVELRFQIIGIKSVFMGVDKKLPVLKKWMNDESLLPEEIAYMGDDIPDLACMRMVGLPCAPYDACAEARATATYISRFSGGYGCGRDIIEQVMKSQNKWKEDA